MDAPTSPAPPTLARLAELIHQAIDVDDGSGPDALFAYVRHHDDDEELELGLWRLPLDGWPCAPLVGLVAPASWTAVGVALPGRAHHLDDDGAAPDRAVVTALADRSGDDASVLRVGDGDGVLHAERAPGMVSDVLARMLGRPTPRPEHSTAAMVEVAWMDRVGAGLAHRSGRGRSWSWFADRHPLRGAGPVPEPGDLAIRTRAHAAAHSWAGLRHGLDGAVPPDDERRPTGGEVIDLASWFDDGAFSRWLLRDLPMAEAVVADARRRVDAAVVEALDDALVALG